MKQHMMIIGCKILHSDDEKPDNSVFQLVLRPLTIVKQKTRLIGLASSGFEGLMNEAKRLQQDDTIVIINLGEWRDNGYKIGKHVTLEMLPDETIGGIK